MTTRSERPTVDLEDELDTYHARDVLGDEGTRRVEELRAILVKGFDASASEELAQLEEVRRLNPTACR